MGCFASKSEETQLDDGDGWPVKPTKADSKDGKASSASAPPGETTQLIDEITERVAGIRGKAEEYRSKLQNKVIDIEQEQAEKSKDDKSNFNGVVIAAYSPESDLAVTTLLEAKQGQRVEIIVRDSGGWSYCRLEETSAMGWLPSSRVAEIARVIADHDAAGHEGLLSVVKNDYVEVVNRHYSGWALCREWKGPPLPGAPETKEGWVTDSYLEDMRSETMLASKWHRLVLQALDQVVESALELEVVLAQAKAQDWGTDVPMEWMGQCLEFARWLTSELQSITQALSQHEEGCQSGSYATVQWETSPGSDAELAVSAGARVLVLDADNQDWAWCRLETTGDEGWVPRVFLKPEADDRPSPADGPGLKFEDLPSWVRENTPARWWSTSGSRYCEVLISKVDLAEREVTVTFKVDLSCWKSVGFDHFAQSPDDWLLQPLEEKALELRMQLPSWIEVGTPGFWWSASQQRVHRVTIDKVCTKRRAVYVTFDVDSQVRKNVPFHEMIDDPDACLLQKSDKDHVWRMKTRKGKRVKRKKEKKTDAQRIEGLPAGDDGTDLDDLIDDDDDEVDDDELEALVLSGTGRKWTSKEALGHSFNMGASSQLDTIFNDMQQDMGNMPGGSEAAAAAAAAGAWEDPWASGILLSPTAPEGTGLRTVADTVTDEEARPPSIGRANSTTFEELDSVVAAALGAEAPDASSAPTGGEGLRPPSDPVDPSADASSADVSAAEGAGQDSLRQRTSTIALDELREELETITVTDTPAAERRSVGALAGAAGGALDDGGGDDGDLLESGGASASGAEVKSPCMPGRFATPSKQVPDLADIQGTATPAQPQAAGSPSVAGNPAAPTPGMPTPGPPTPGPRAEEEGGCTRHQGSAGGSRPVSTAPSVGGSIVGDLRDVKSRVVGGTGGPRGAANAMEEDYTTSEQGLMDQLDSLGGTVPSGLLMAAQASAEDVFYSTHDKKLLEELTGDSLVSPSGAAVAVVIAATADSAPAPAPAPPLPSEGEGGRAQFELVENLAAPAPFAEPDAAPEPAPLPPPFDGDEAGASPPRPADARASSAWGGGDDRGGAARPPRRLAAASAWGDEPTAGAAEASPSKPAPARKTAPLPGGEGMGKMGSMGSLQSEDVDPIDKDLREAADAFGGGSSSSALLKQAMRVALPDTWDSEGEGGRREPPDLRRLAEAWPELSDELAADGASREEKLRKSLDEELTREEARVDAIVQEVGHKLEQRAKSAEAKLDPSGAQKYRSMQWTVMNAGESFKESCKEELDTRAALRKERSRRQRENLRKAIEDPAAAAVSAFLPGAESIQKLRPDVAFDEVAEAVRDLFRSVEVTALRPASAQNGPANFFSMDRSVVISQPFEQVGEAAVRALGDSVAELLTWLRSQKEALPPKDDIIEDLQWDGLSKEQKRDKKMFDGQQEFDWDRAVKLGSEERARKRTAFFTDKVQRADNILRRRWRRSRDHDRSATMQRLAAFGDAIGQAEDRIRQIYRDSAERADAEVESVVEERRSTQQQAELMLSAALIVREEKETMNNAWYAAPRERQQVMHKCLKRVRRLQEDIKNEKVVPELQQKLSVLLYSLRMLEAKLMNECQATLNDIQDGPVKLNSKQKKQLEDSRRAFEEQLEADIDRIRAAKAARAERAVSRLAFEFRATAESKHAPSLQAARAALAASAASAARADLAAVALRALGEAAASFYAEAARHTEVAKSPLDAPSFLPKRKRLIEALNASLTTLERLEHALSRPTEQLAAAAASGAAAAAAAASAGTSGDRDWAAALAGAEKRWSEFCERHPGREPGDDGDETPRSQAEIMEEGSPPRPLVAMELGDLSQDGMSPKGSVASLQSVDSPGIPPGSRAGGRNSRGGARAKANPTGKAKAKSQAKGSSPRGDRPERPTSAVPNQRPPSAGGQRGAPPARKVGFQAVAKGSDIGAEPRSRGAKGQGAELLAQLDELSQAMDKTLGKTTGTFSRPSGVGAAPSRAAPPARRGSGNSLGATTSGFGGGFGGGSPPARRGGAAAAW